MSVIGCYLNSWSFKGEKKKTCQFLLLFDKEMLNNGLQLLKLTFLHRGCFVCI